MASTRSSSRRSAGGSGDVLNPATIQFLDATRLRKELEQRGLDSTGAKNALADRLQEAVELEKMGCLPQPATVESLTPPKKKQKKTETSPKGKQKKTEAATADNEDDDDETEVTPEKDLLPAEPPKESTKPPVVVDSPKKSEKIEVVKTPIITKLPKRHENSATETKKHKSEKKRTKEAEKAVNIVEDSHAAIVEVAVVDREPKAANSKKAVQSSSSSHEKPKESLPKTSAAVITNDKALHRKSSSDSTASAGKVRPTVSISSDKTRVASSSTATASASPLPATTAVVQSDKKDGRPEQAKTRPAPPKPARIAQRHQASANVLDSIFDKQTQMLKPKTETEKAADRQRIELQKRRESNTGLTYGLGPMQKPPTTPTVAEAPPLPAPPPPPPKRPSGDTTPLNSLLPPPPPPPGPPPSKRQRTSDDVSPTASSEAAPSSSDAPTRPLSRDRVSAASTPSSEASQPSSVAAKDATPKSPIERPPSNSGTVPPKESDPDKMQKVFSVLSAVFAAKLGIVLPTPGCSMDAQQPSTVAASDAVANEPIEAVPDVEPMDEDESEACAPAQEPLVDSQPAEAELCSVNETDEQPMSSSDVLLTDDQQNVENTSEPVVERPITEQPIAPDDLMKDPRALLDRASAVLQQMQQRKQIKEESEEPTILYEQLEPDPDCEAVEEEKPLPHFHGEPVPEDMDDEEAPGAELSEIIQPGRPRKRNLLRARRVVEEEPQLNEAEVQLDYYSSDLHLKPAQDNRYQVDPENKDGFALMWGGIKASYGVRSGKVAYQVKIIEFLSMNHLPFEEIDPHDLRVGWSETNAPYQLGEAAHSYAFCSVGRKALNNVFSEYGQPFHQDDVITCCLDLTKREISYYKNGEPLGVAFSDIPMNSRNSSMDEESLAPSLPEEDMVFFPHVATKNCKFEVNFGQQGVWGSLPDGFRFMNDLGVDERIRGPVAPANKSDCTVLMMVGLPGVGKSTWVRQYLREHLQERWTVLNSETIMSAMKVNGVARRRVHQGRWDMIMGLTAKALTRSLHLACRRRKNYIIDQTNVAKDTRRKKLGQFREFQRKCVVIIPDDDEFINRQFRQAKSDGTGPMPVEAMLELKAVFSIPNVNIEPIEDVHFVEPPADRLHEAFELVNKYNQEARPWYQKRYRGRPPIAFNDSNSGGRSGGGRRFDSRRSQQPPLEQFSPVDTAPIAVQAVPSNADSRPRRIIHEDSGERHSSGEEEPAEPSRDAVGVPSSGWAPTQIAAGWDRPGGWVNRPNEGYAGFGDSLPQSLIPPPPKEKPAELPATAILWAERKQQQNVNEVVIIPPADPSAPSS